MLILGYDPGGSKKRANGVALLELRSPAAVSGRIGSLASVDEVLEWFRDQTGAIVPDAAGIDTLLSWSTRSSGLRVIDERLRTHYEPVWKSVQASNSIYGSMCVQGMASAVKLGQRWASIRLNETHPKVAYYACMKPRRKYNYGNKMVNWLLAQFNPPLRLNRSIKNDHEWDALFSAWATWQGLLGLWHTDLMAAAQKNEQLLFPAGSVTYYWPEEVP